MLRVLGMLEIFVRAHRRLPWSRLRDVEPKLPYDARGLSRQSTRVAQAMPLDGRCDKPATTARYRLRYKSAWSTAKRGRATPGWCEGRRHAPEDASQTNAAARAGWRFRPVPARRAGAPW